MKPHGIVKQFTDEDGHVDHRGLDKERKRRAKVLIDLIQSLDIL